MKRFALIVLVACSGGDKKPVERPVVPDVVQAPAVTPPIAQQPAGPVRAPVKVVKETHHGVTVEDPYRWLEGDDADVKRWTASQSTHARKILDGLPEIEVLRQEITAIVKAPITHYGGLHPAGGKLFATRKQPSKEQSELILLDDLAKGDAKLVLDPTAAGSTTRSIDWYEPSPDGTKIAVSLSEKGSEEGDLHVFDLDGKEIEPAIPNVQRATGGGSVAWTPDSKGFYYTRYPSPGEKPDAERSFWMQVYFHALGTPVANDRYELGKDFPKIAEVVVSTDPKGRVLAKIQNGDGGEFRHYLRDAKGAWRQLGDWKDGIVYVGFGTTPDLWVISRKDAPRGKLMKLPAAAKSIADAKVVVAEGKDSIVTDFYGSDWGVVDGGDRLYVTYQVGGPMELRAFTRAGKATTAPVLPPVASSSKPVVFKDGSVVVVASSYTTPRTFYRFEPKANKTTPIAALSPKPPVDLAGLEVVREFATSKDGTKVPFTILWPKAAKRDGSVPCLAMGYGGYGLSETPAYLATYAPLLSRGVCIVETNLRGGGEFGEDWHKAGMLTKKQNVFDDFAAVLQFLVDNKITSTAKLAILGGSNGGLLMGATLVQHPGLVKAVVSLVGVYDSVRAENSSNGEYNVTEYGSVKDKAQFDAIFAYSPYHHVAKARYPAILMTAGENDARVPPWHSRKFTAALQAAQTGDAPILLRTSATAGHGAGTATSERINDLAQMFAFVLWQIRT